MALKQASTLPTRVDPVTFEILRHRLWSINEEAGHTLERVSGSLIASEVHDMNTSIMNAQGDSLVLAPYMLVHAISMETLAKDVVGNYQDNPGIRAGDILLATVPPVGLSARNVLPGRIASLEQRDVIVSARVKYRVEMEVHLTLAARDSLQLAPGREVWLVIKTHSCHLMQK